MRAPQLRVLIGNETLCALSHYQPPSQLVECAAAAFDGGAVERIAFIRRAAMPVVGDDRKRGE